MGAREEALNAINKAMERFPNNVALYYARALIFQTAADLEKAITDYTVAIQLYKDTPRKKRTETLQDFADSFGRPAIDKKGAALYLARGIALSQNGEFKQARRDLKRAGNLNSNLRKYLPDGLADDNR
jgi:tetratricopeptide (TPR) repeat protein